MKQKIQYLDDARTLAILWVVLIQHNFAPYGSHFGWVPNGSCELFNSTFLAVTGYFTYTTMPICFFVAGIVAALSNKKDQQTFMDVLKKKAKRLLVPALIFGLIFQILIEHSVSYKGVIGYMHFWFIIDLFIISLVFMKLNDRVKFGQHVVLSLCAVCIAGLISNRLFNFCMGYFFYLIGFMITVLYKRSSVKFSLDGKWIFILFCLSVITYLFGLHWKVKSIVEPLFAIPVFLAILKGGSILHNSCWMMLCKYSYGIYIFHMIYLYLMYDGFNCVGGGDSFLLENAYWLSTLLAFATIPLSVVTTKLVNKTKIIKI